MSRKTTILLSAAAILTATVLSIAAVPPDHGQLRADAKRLFAAGNYKEALEKFRKLALHPDVDQKLVGDDLQMAVHALNNLGRSKEVDPLIEDAVGVHGENWRLLQKAAHIYRHSSHWGYLITGEFERGNHRGGGKYVSSAARDRVRGLQLLEQARHLAVEQEASNADVAQLYSDYAMTLRSGSGNTENWRLQSFTNLEELPDYEVTGWRGYGGAQGAPVDATGNPVLHDVPDSFETAESDGERWRWMLAEAGRLVPGRELEFRMRFAQMLYESFSCNTLRQYSWWGQRRTRSDQKSGTGTFDLHTLGEQETIAKLATGIKRFELPDEHNFIRVYQAVAKARKSGEGQRARDRLAEIFENRRQYPTAATAWRTAIAEYGTGPSAWRTKRLNQIVKNWGRFENSITQPSGRGAIVDYRYRNGKSVQFEAWPIRTELLLQDAKAYLKSSPNRIDGEQMEVQNIGYRLVNNNQTKYLKEKAAEWTVELDPPADHVDDRITVTTPLQTAGAYLVSAKMENGNTSRMILWVNDTVIAKKQLDGKVLYFVADAVTGKPVAKANIEFFGYRTERVDNSARYQVKTVNFAEFTDENGQLTIASKRIPVNHRWVTIARTDSGRLAHLGWDYLWFGRHHDSEYTITKVFLITDRPVYRPEQTVQYKFWVRNAQFDQEDVSRFAGQTFPVQVTTPQGEVVHSENVKADEFGGITGKFLLKNEAQLGVYSLQIPGYGGGSFRVEEYKKPEFEVKIAAPDKPVQLGEKITATIEAKYYFGAPVANGKVKYKVLRASHDARWYPRGRWDWFYGRGYWWFAYDCDWYPGWQQWGCESPIWWWWPAARNPPEVVAEAEVEIGDNGRVEIEIDTALAKEMHSDQDHRYQITAEVVDESRRTIVGQGQVLVAREPFKVFAWVNRGHYRTGDAVTAEFQAHTPDQTPVAGNGHLSLYRVKYEDGEAIEEAVAEWELATNVEGRARQQFKAGGPGQYRLSYKVTDAAGHTQEGGYLFTVIGQGFNGRGFRFNDIELITDKREYKPGEKVRLLINTQHTDSTLLLFVRPTNGVYLPPQTVRVDGKSTVHEIAIGKRDMPNFFVEALTVSDAKIHTEMREIVVPPEKRVLTLDVEPSETTYQPGEEATVKVRLTDHEGNPFIGSTVLSVYDRSVEYISGGSNVPGIRDFFWKWRRHHRPATHSSLKWGFNVVKPGDIHMRNLGIFGHTVVEEMLGAQQSGQRVARRGQISTASKYAGRDLPMAEAASEAPGFGGFGDGDKFDADEESDDSGSAGNEDVVQPTVRTNFADTAFWAASITTDEDGRATVRFPMPENLTGWKIKAWGMGHGTKVGEGEAEVVTAKNILVRMQAPRFFVEKDEVVLSANVHNYLEEDKEVKVSVLLEGGTLVPTQPMSIPRGASEEDYLKAKSFDLGRTLLVPAGGEVRVDWRVKVIAEGEASVTMRALTDEESDAMQMKFPCYVHGMLKTESYSGVVRVDDDSQQFTVRVPTERRPEQTRLEVRYSPTLAGAMVDALPYLVNYPHRCTEQTLNRFIPTVITQRILHRMGLDLAAIQEKRTNLNAQEIGDDVERAKRWKVPQWDMNPVFDEARVERMVKDNVQRLTSMQLSDGGWGWFSGYGERSGPHTTATVVHGLQIAVENDVAIVPGVLERGIKWLERWQAEQVRLLRAKHRTTANNLDALVFMVLSDAGRVNTAMRDFLYRDRTQLSAYGKSVYGIALHEQEQTEKLAMILRNLEQFLVEDDENQSAYLQLPGNNWWWYWWGNDIESNAWYLKLLARTEPGSERSAGLVKYILNNRRNGTYWKSTRDTAYCIEAFAEYLKASGEDRPDMTIEVFVDGKRHKSVKVDASNLFNFDNRLILEGDALGSGEHNIEVRRTGTGPVYFNAYLTNFTLEDFITKAGLEVKVNRRYYKLTEVKAAVDVAGSRGQVVSQKVSKFERTPLDDMATVKSGDLVEVELEIESKNDYEYLLFEDMKAAGFEPVDVRSGYNGNEMGAYVEFRDERVCLFVRQLARGRHSVSYRLRAEVPGRFSALPTRASAMYAPELKANSDETRLSIID